jgi:hypothetical protein
MSSDNAHKLHIVGVPDDKEKMELRRLKKCLQGLGIKSFELHVPTELKVGTLDELMLISDELAKLDKEAEELTRKIKRKFLDVIPAADRMKKERDLNPDGLSPTKYYESFAWYSAGYPCNLKLRSIHNHIQRRIQQSNHQTAKDIVAHQDIKAQIASLQRKSGGNLLTQDIDDVMRGLGKSPADVAKYFQTSEGDFSFQSKRLLVCCSTTQGEEFEKSYTNIDKTAITVFDDQDDAVPVTVPMVVPLTTFTVRTENKRILQVKIGTGGRSPSVEEVKSALATQHKIQYGCIRLEVRDLVLKNGTTMADHNVHGEVAGQTGLRPTRIDLCFQDASANTNRKATDHMSPVVPDSIQFLKSDADGNSMYSVLVIRGKDDQYIHTFKHSCQKLRYTVREWVPPAEGATKVASTAEELEALTRAEGEKKTQIVNHFPKHFVSVYKASAHIKVLRVFADAVLRFGLPPNFVAVVVNYDGKKDLKAKAEKALEKLYSNLDYLGIAAASNDASGDGAAAQNQILSTLITNKDEQQYYPFVYIPVDVMEEKHG